MIFSKLAGQKLLVSEPSPLCGKRITGCNEEYIYQYFTMNATFVKGVVANANSQQFGIFLPSFVILCIMLAIGVPGNTLALLVNWRKLQNGIARELFITLCLGDLLSCVFVTLFELYIMTHFFNYAGERSCKLLRLFSYCVNNITSCVELISHSPDLLCNMCGFLLAMLTLLTVHKRFPYYYRRQIPVT